MLIEPFVFEWFKPCMDWFETKRITINSDDYYYFRIERRFGPTWWLMGQNPKDEPKYHWEQTQIGEIREGDLRRFIEWAKTDKGSKIIEIKSICGSFNIIEEILKVLPKAIESNESPSPTGATAVKTFMGGKKDGLRQRKSNRLAESHDKSNEKK